MANRKLKQKGTKRMMNRKRTNAPRQRVRPTRVIHSRGSSSISTNVIRRMIWAPKKFGKTGAIEPPEKKWWLEGLKMLGVVIMKIITAKAKSALRDSFCKENNLPIDAEISVPTGASMTLAFGVEDLLSDSMFVDLSSDQNSIMKYRQGRLEWVKINIIPAATTKERGGSLIALIKPVTRDQFATDYADRTAEFASITELLAQPGVLMKTAATTTSLTWSPKPSDWAYDWQMVGCLTAESGIANGGMPIFYLSITYSDLSANSADLTTEYSLSEATFDVVIESRVLLRQSETISYIRREPIQMMDSSTIGILDYQQKSNTKAYTMCNGCFVLSSVSNSSTMDTGSGSFHFC